MKINEIFNSIDGEVNQQGGQGTFSTFIRLQGCNLRCSYCDTRQAQDYHLGTEICLPDIFKRVEEIGCKKITITGGEPLLQIETRHLISKFISGNYSVSLETNGSIDISEIDSRCGIVIDYKLPSSGQEGKMLFENFTGGALEEKDFVKFVIQDRRDYEGAKEVMEMVLRETSPGIAFSSNLDVLAPDVLMQWIQEDKLFDVKLNIQIHKLIEVK